MTLTAEPKLVKLPRYAWLLWLASLVSVLGTLAFIAANNGAPEQRMAYGQALADNLALLAREPFVAQDKIQLGLLSKRIAQLPQIAAVTIVDVNEQVLANMGVEPIGAHHSTPVATASVQIDDNLAGYVRIGLDEPAFASTPSWRHVLFGVLLALLVPALLLWARQWWLNPGRRSAVVAVDFEREASGPARDPGQPQFVIAANLFNRLGMTSEQQHAAQHAALSWAEQIAPLYGGRAQTLDQAAVVIRIPDSGQDDCAFAALCAGLLWGRCLTESSGYRLGAHVVELAGEPANQNPQAEQDALLLAAIAGNGKLSLSATMLAAMERPERIALQSAQGSMHEDLPTVGDCLYQVQSIAQHYEALLNQQAETLSAKLAAAAERAP